MNYAAHDDVSLLGLVAQAHPEALGELYDRYNRLVFSIAAAMVGDPATAAEITLDVFTDIWRRAATYRVDRAKVSTWLIAITRHRAIDVLRRQNSRPEANSLGWNEILLPDIPAAHDLEEQVEDSLRRERVRAAVAQLPADQQQALALAYFKGYTHHQIAEALHQPLGTVKTRIRAAMHKLRQILREEQPALD